MLTHSKERKEQIDKFAKEIFPTLYTDEIGDYPEFVQTNYSLQNKRIKSLKYNIFLSLEEDKESFDKSVFGPVINGLELLGIPFSSITTENLKRYLEAVISKYEDLKNIDSMNGTFEFSNNFMNMYNPKNPFMSKVGVTIDIYKRGIRDHLDYFEKRKNSMLLPERYNSLAFSTEKLFEVVDDILNYPDNHYTYEDLEPVIEKAKEEIIAMNKSIQDSKSNNPRDYYELILDDDYKAIEDKTLLPHFLAAGLLNYINSDEVNSLKQFIERLSNGYFDEILLFDTEKAQDTVQRETFDIKTCDIFDFYRYLIQKLNILIQILEDRDKYYEAKNDIENESKIGNDEYYSLLDYAINLINDYLYNNRDINKVKVNQ